MRTPRGWAADLAFGWRSLGPIPSRLLARRLERRSASRAILAMGEECHQ